MVCSTSRSGRPFWRRHPVVTGTAALVTFWWLANGWYEAVAVTAIVGLLIFVSRRRKRTAIRDAGLRARADYEYRLSLAGDQRGVFGRYPPGSGRAGFRIRRTVAR